MASFAEGKMEAVLRTDAKQMMTYNASHLSRIYPAGTRFASSNYSPYWAWAMGCQFVALNYQTLDLSMQMNMALFYMQGRCGYILRPDFQRALSGAAQNHFDELVVQVYSARQLPKKKALEAAEKSVIDPYVEVRLMGNPKDERVEKTKVVPGNGFAPTWRETFRFRLTSSSTAFLLLSVLDAPNERRIAWYALPVESIRPGHRLVPLLDDSGRELPTGNLFCHFALNNTKLTG